MKLARLSRLMSVLSLAGMVLLPAWSRGYFSIPSAPSS